MTNGRGLRSASEQSAMSLISETPEVVRHYLALIGQPPEVQTAALPAMLAHDVRFTFAGTTHLGKEAVIARITGMQGGLTPRRWIGRSSPVAARSA